MNRTMAHRGPDGEGYNIYDTNFGRVGLGHRRLSIIDLSEGGSQPMHFENLHITFNGEIYNYEEIKNELETLGHHFESHSDTEVILHSYKQWGAAALQKFIGMFAFVIYNDETQDVFACRDRAGVKPFFYYYHNGLFLFASELKAIVKYPTFVKEIDLNAVGAFMQHGYVPTPHCIFLNTYKLKPGYYLKLDMQTKNLQTTQYWNVYDSYNKPALKIDLPEAIEETEKLLLSAFQYRMVSDVPVGVFLSGGYDSSCVTALLQANNSQKIKTFTIGMPDAGLNEAPYAKQVANHLGTEHTEYYCTEKEALEIVPKLPFFYDEPFADSSAIPTSLVSRIAKEKVTVALSADGGDEIFAGYSRYDYHIKYGDKLNSIPSFVRKSAASLMHAIPAQSIPILNKNYLFHSRYEKLKNVLKQPSDSNILQSITQHLDKSEIDLLIKNPVSKISSGFDSEELMPEYYSGMAYMMAIDYQTYMLDDILQKVDRATMSVSLEGREPFLDQRIIEWAAQLPMNFKYRNGSKKFIIKEIVHKYLPKELMDRPKMGFGIPIAKWLQADLKIYVDHYLNVDFIRNQNIFNKKAVALIYTSFYKGKVERAEKLWHLLMFQLWYEKWMMNN